MKFIAGLRVWGNGGFRKRPQSLPQAQGFCKPSRRPFPPSHSFNLHRSFTFVAGFWEDGTLGTSQSQSPTIGASCEELRLAERRGRESLPFPVLPGYRPMHCLEGLLSGGRTANRTRVYIHALASPAARAFRVPG